MDKVDKLEEAIKYKKALPMRFKDITGQRFGKLIAAWPAGKYKGNRDVVWLCFCDCGKFKPIPGTVLRRGVTKSCGCEMIRIHIKHGECVGDYMTPEYRAYIRANRRCNNSKDEQYSYYGGRGIKFLFNSYPEFLTEIGRKPSPKHSLDRINNNGPYEVGNVRWATKKEQVYNRRPFKIAKIENFTDKELINEIKRRKKWYGREFKIK